jgi:hypothetical protein
MWTFIRRRKMDSAFKLGDSLGLDIRFIWRRTNNTFRDSATGLIDRLIDQGCNEKDILIFLCSIFIRALPAEKIPVVDRTVAEWAGKRLIRASVADGWREEKAKFDAELEEELARRMESAHEYADTVARRIRDVIPGREALDDNFVIGYVAGLVHAVGDHYCLDDGAYSVLVHEIVTSLCRQGEEDDDSVVLGHIERLRSSIEHEEPVASEGFGKGVEDGLRVLGGDRDLVNLQAHFGDGKPAE